MLRLSLPVLGVNSMRRAIDFWGKALRYQVHEGGPAASWTVLGPAMGAESGPELALQLSESPPERRPRLHLDLSVEDAAEQAAEVRRLTSLGAQRVDWDLYPRDPDFVVLADPEGNLFCVVDASHN
jgi:catechol 2,3-dioxygenase-like lactoylglutathione lyase family enzyme